MIEHLIEWSIRHRFLVIMVALLVAFAGVRAMWTMPVDAIPDLSENQVIVFTDWEGRSPQEIEDQVTFPLSVNLQGLAGVKVVRSSSEFNFSMINLIFDDTTDFYFARQRVLERLSIAQTFLPEGVTPYLAPDATALGQIFWYTVEGDGKDLGELRALQDWFVRYQLNSVPGVAEVASVGGAPREYQIDLDPERLRAFNVTLGQIYTAVQRANAAVGGRVLNQGNAEYLIRSVGWIRDLDDLRRTVVAERDGTPITVGDVASVQMGAGTRRSVLEKDGREVVGGVVLMRHGENPLAVTERVKQKITALGAGLPEGVRIVPFYDRTPLIENAMETVSRTVREELLICTIAILLVMGHLGGAFIVALTLPLAVLFSFLMMHLFGIPSNIMSLAGIAISVGILEDQAVVMTENAAHHLTRRFGDKPVKGNVLAYVIPACRTVGRPIFFSVLITILSFLPVFALSGREGKMFHPLAFTKTFALVGVAVLAVTLVPALIPVFLKGRIKSEEKSWIVRTMTSIYKPMLTWLMNRPLLVCWLFACILGTGYLASTRLGREFMPDLDEGSILDMPTSVPRISVTQVTQDLMARDAVLRMFPEVVSVVGKAGRAETATDPSPLEMIETIINLRDRELWPKRSLRYEDVVEQTKSALGELQTRGVIDRPKDVEAESSLVNDAAMLVSQRVDVDLRALAHRRLAEFRTELGERLVEDALDAYLARVDRSSRLRPLDPETRARIVHEGSDAHGARLAVEPLYDEVAGLVRLLSRLLVEAGVLRAGEAIMDAQRTLSGEVFDTVGALVGRKPRSLIEQVEEDVSRRHRERLMERMRTLNWELFDQATLNTPRQALGVLAALAGERKLAKKELAPNIMSDAAARLEVAFAERVFLWRKTKRELEREMDSALQVPGWGNIWTQPIINRINMLATGVRAPIGVKVFGDDLEKVQRVSQRIAEELRKLPGAVNVVPDQLTGKGYVEISIDRERAARFGVQVGDVQDVIEVALGGKPITTTVEGRRRFPVRMRYARDFRDDAESLRNVLIVAGSGGMERSSDARGSQPGEALQIPLAQVADINVVEGPAMIKSENGLLRAYVQLGVHDRDVVGFVEHARDVVSKNVELPEGMYVEWAGDFEHELRARTTLRIVFPAVAAVIVVILYLTYRSWIDALLMMTAVLGALAGGAIFQWLFGFPFSVAVWVGYIACFGMATETGIVMLVYLREAISNRGGLDGIQSVGELREAILEGAVHRLRPKLLTEGTTIIAIAPMLWADGVGAEVIRPMAAPVLGGLLVADEVIDIFLPVLYFSVKKWEWRRLHRLPPFATALPTPGIQAAPV